MGVSPEPTLTLKLTKSPAAIVWLNGPVMFPGGCAALTAPESRKSSARASAPEEVIRRREKSIVVFIRVNSFIGFLTAPTRLLLMLAVFLLVTQKAVYGVFAPI